MNTTEETLIKIGCDVWKGKRIYISNARNKFIKLIYKRLNIDNYNTINYDERLQDIIGLVLDKCYFDLDEQSFKMMKFYNSFDHEIDQILKVLNDRPITLKKKGK